MATTKMTRNQWEKEKTLEEEIEEELETQKLDQGNWIMIIKKLPLAVRVPPMSIHWSHPWPNREFAISSLQREVALGIYPGGQDPDFVKARMIFFQNEKIRVFPHEFSLVKPENMRSYTIGLPGEDEPSHTLRPGGLAEKDLIVEIEQGEKRLVYDAALVDGATPSQAFRVAMGQEVESLDFPPIGWYECRPDYVSVYFDPDPEPEEATK